MSSRTRKILLATGLAALAGTGALFWAAQRYQARLEPYVRDRVKEYLAQRFESEVELESLRLQFPRLPSLRLFLTRGRNVIARVEGRGIVLRHHGRRDVPPLFTISSLAFELDLGKLFDPEKSVALIHLDGLRLVIPPKGERPAASGPPPAASRRYRIHRVVIENSTLSILPRKAGRQPLDFDLHRVTLDSLHLAEALTYEAELTNPKPIGLVRAKGSFGPWNAESPADTPLSGDYAFSDADLGVFKAIAGLLQSKGKFTGTLNEIDAEGEATVPDFRLKAGGHPKRLDTWFQVRVDGTNGDTILKPVRARLGTSHFTTTGAVLKHDGDTRKTIDLEARVPHGELKDFLDLALRGEPPMRGVIELVAKVKVPPLSGKVSEKLRLDGRFIVRQGQFLKEALQDKVDLLSRRAQGQPKNLEIDDVFSQFQGAFHLENEQLTLRSMGFEVPGAHVALDGTFDLDADQLDLDGTLKLDVKVSQTMSGWKRWALKPVDPFFAKQGAGTFLKIKVAGSSKSPQFSARR